MYYLCGVLLQWYTKWTDLKANEVMIEVKDVSFKYAGSKVQVFTGFNLKMGAGKVYGLLGKNGTGKSTLLYLIAGLLRPQRGSVSMDGVDTAGRRVETLREMFIVPEEFYLPDVSLDAYVRTNAPFYPRFSREVLDRCLADFGLGGRLRLGSLSMGQKKKVYMSFALAAGTRLVLMDEPTNGLDIPSKGIFRRVVAQCMAADRTLVVSTHQVHDVEQLLDHLVVISTDGLLLDASVADVCSRYSFELRQPGGPQDGVVYSEPTLQGNAVIARRADGAPETQLNLELLFEAVVQGKIGRGDFPVGTEGRP